MGKNADLGVLEEGGEDQLCFEHGKAFADAHALAATEREVSKAMALFFFFGEKACGVKAVGIGPKGGVSVCGEGAKDDGGTCGDGESVDLVVFFGASCECPCGGIKAHGFLENHA